MNLVEEVKKINNLSELTELEIGTLVKIGDFEGKYAGEKDNNWMVIRKLASDIINEKRYFVGPNGRANQSTWVCSTEKKFKEYNDIWETRK